MPVGVAVAVRPRRFREVCTFGEHQERVFVPQFVEIRDRLGKCGLVEQPAALDVDEARQLHHPAWNLGCLRGEDLGCCTNLGRECDV